MSLGRFVCQAVAAIALAAASSPGAVLLSETFQSGSPNLPSGWFSAVAVGSGVPFVQSPNLDGSAFGYLTGQSEVQLYTPILTTQGPYPLRLEFDIAGMSTFVIAMVVEVSINGGAYADFATVGQYLPGRGPVKDLATFGIPLPGYSNGFAVGGAGQILAGPAAPTSYQFRFRTAAGGNVSSPELYFVAIGSVTVTTADPVSATPEPAPCFAVALALVLAATRHSAAIFRK